LKFIGEGLPFKLNCWVGARISGFNAKRFTQNLLYLRLLFSRMHSKIKFPIFSIVVFLVGLFFLVGCNSENNKNKTEKQNLSTTNEGFRNVNGIRFFEVNRRFKNGLSFNRDGFYHQPTWIIQYKAPDSMLAYSPQKNKMEAFYLQFDHGQVYNFAREYFRVKVITKDSLVLQRLQVDGKIIADDKDIRSDVYSTYYSRDYIENILHTTIGELQRPTRADTAFIQDLSNKTYRDPSNPAVAFAAVEPVVFKPKGPFVSVEKISTMDETNKRNQSVDYMYPTYTLTISKAYKEFAYSFSLVVDANGKMYVNRVEGVMQEDMPPRKRLLQGITDVYLKNLFKVIPGKTLGIPHSSEVSVFLIGKLAK
jgi:uncharacterized protein YdhG (YjbR/CyaY superfamily)